MRKIRIGNDIEVAWEVKTGGEALSLEGRRLRVYVRSAYERQEIEEFSVEGCVVRFVYPAKMQRAVGARAVELVDETKDVRTVCADEAFTLVAHTSEEDDNAAVGNDGAQEFERYLVSLKSNVVVARPGMSAYEIWKGQGNEGTEEDFLASITGPKGEKGEKGDDFNGIKRIWRLEGGGPKDIELNGNEIDLEGLTLDQWLIKKGNYAAVKVTPMLNMPPTHDESPMLLLDLGETKIYYTAYVLNGQLKGTIDIMDTTGIVYTGEAPNDNNAYATIYIYPKCIVANDYKQTGYYIECSYFAADLHRVEVSNITRVYYNLSYKTGPFTTCLIPFDSKNNYGIQFADGHYERLNKTDNVRIGGYANVYKYGIYGDVFYKEGSLEVNGSLKARDTTINGKLEVKGSMDCNGINSSGTIDNGHFPLITGETTIQGTLHVENSDIKSKSIYPAKTGSGTLKDASKGKVKGNYKVSASNLGKGAHNYDKLFVKNILWSDQTDIDNPDTSLNGEGTIRVWSKEGFDKKPTLWVQDGTQTDNAPGIYNNGQGVTIERRGDDGGMEYSVTVTEDGKLKDNVMTMPFVWGNGECYDENNKIPQEFVFPKVTFNNNIPYQEYDRRIDVSQINFVGNQGQGIYILNGNSYEDESSSFNGIELENINGSRNDIYIKSDNSRLYISTSIDNASPTKCFATNGTHFDMNTKADLVDGAVQMEQMPKDVRKTVKKAKKREVRYIPFKAINMNSVNDGRYENRYVYNMDVYNNIVSMPLIIDRKVKKAKISFINGMVAGVDLDFFNNRYGSRITVEEDGDYYVFSDHEYRFYLKLHVDFGDDAICNSDYIAYKPVSYSVDDDGAAEIVIEMVPINQDITFSRKDYKLLSDGIYYTGVAHQPGFFSLTPANGKVLFHHEIWKAVMTRRENLRKGITYRVHNAEDKNLYYAAKSKKIKIRKRRLKGSFIKFMGANTQYCRLTIAGIKVDRFRHKSIHGYSEYKISGYPESPYDFYIKNIKKI